MPILANKRHEIFALQLSEGRTQDEAYSIAGFKATKGSATARAAASRLAAKVNIKARVEELSARKTNETVQQAALTKAWVIQQARELFEAAKKAGNHSAAKGVLELLGREVRAFVERKNLTVRRLDDLSDEDLQEMFDELRSSETGDES